MFNYIKLISEDAKSKISLYLKFLTAMFLGVSLVELRMDGSMNGLRRSVSKSLRLDEFCAAKWRAVWLPLVVALTSQFLQCSKRAATCACPQKHALCRGLHPSAVRALMSAPFESKNFKLCVL